MNWKKIESTSSPIAKVVKQSCKLPLACRLIYICNYVIEYQHAHKQHIHLHIIYIYIHTYYAYTRIHVHGAQMVHFDERRDDAIAQQLVKEHMQQLDAGRPGDLKIPGGRKDGLHQET